MLVHGSPMAGSGATKLVAEAALRTGAGLVTVASDATTLPVYAASFKAVMVKQANSTAQTLRLIAERKINAAVIGCGNGTTKRTKKHVLALLALPHFPLLLDADALNVFHQHTALLFPRLHPHCVLTPHAGEFARLFPNISLAQQSREAAANKAAKQAGAVVVLKGKHTIIADPAGQILVHDSAPPSLATAGTGDVLSGMIGSFLAQGMPPFYAAAAGVYLHSACANILDKYFIADDLLTVISQGLAQLYAD